MRDLPLLAAAAGLLLGGGSRAVAAGGMDVLASVLVGAGLVVFGIWVRDHYDDKDNPHG